MHWIMLVETSLASTSRFSTAPWQVEHCSPALSVAGVAEKDKIRHLIDAHPGKLGFSLGQGCQLPDRGAVRGYGGMTKHALVRLGNPGTFLFVRARMAVETLGAGFGVHLVTERDGLGRDVERQVFDLALVAGLGVRWRQRACERREQEARYRSP